MMKRLIPIILLAALLSSCEFGFEVSNNAAPGLYLGCVAGPDKAIIELACASPLGVNAADIPEVKLRELEFSVNGEILPLTDLQVDFGQTLGRPLEPGDKIGLKALAEGLPAVQAATVQPKQPVLDRVTLAKEEVSGVRVSGFDVYLDAQPGAGEYIGVMIRKSCEIKIKGEWKDSVRFLSPSVTAPADPAAEMARVDFFGMAVIRAVSSGRNKPAPHILTMVPASALRDGKLSLTVIDMSAIMQAGQGGAPPMAIPEPPQERNVFYEFRILGVSEDFYRYSLARYKSSSDFLAQMGLAPAQFAWSNVRGGFGVCGAYTSISYSFEEAEILLDN